MQILIGEKQQEKNLLSDLRKGSMMNLTIMCESVPVSRFVGGTIERDGWRGPNDPSGLVS